MRTTGPSIPFFAARAYGATHAQTPRTCTTDAPAGNRADSFQPSFTRTPTGAQRLVAGVVPGGIDFSGDTAQPSASGALPMYRRPADKNAAATSVAAGRIIDVRG